MWGLKINFMKEKVENKKNEIYYVGDYTKKRWRGQRKRNKEKKKKRD